MREPELPPLHTFWTARRLGHTAAGTFLTAVAAALVGISYGAWAIFQPDPQTAVGPISVYVLGAAVLAIAAGWWAGRRVYMVDNGFGDPGRGMIVFFAALAVMSVGIWSSSAVATAHMPDASAHLAASPPVVVVAPPSAGNTAPDTTTRQLNVIPGSKPGTCGSGIAEACSNVLVLFYSRTAGYVQNINDLCRMIYADGSNESLVSTCNHYMQGTAGVPNSSIKDQLTETRNSLSEAAVIVGLPALELN